MLASRLCRQLALGTGAQLGYFEIRAGNSDDAALAQLVGGYLVAPVPQDLASPGPLTGLVLIRHRTSREASRCRRTSGCLGSIPSRDARTRMSLSLQNGEPLKLQRLRSRLVE
jgi:hypothetical protein